MDHDEDYVGQLKQVFDDCDSSGEGLISKQDLILLCTKLQVEDHSGALVERLIGSRDDKRVGFEEFKDGFVAVLSQCADLISTEDEVSASGNSYYDDGAVSPKFVRDGKKYGRRSRPESQGADTPLDFAEISDVEMDNSCSSPINTPVLDGSDRKLHNTPVNQGLASVASPNESARVLSPTDNSIADIYEGEGLLNQSIGHGMSKSELADLEETEALKQIWEKQGVGKDGFLTFQEFGAICENMGLEALSDKDLGEMFEKLDADKDGKVSFDEFVRGLAQHGGQGDGQSNSRPHSSQSKKLKHSNSFVDNDRRTQTPSILSAITGSGYFSCIDPENTGYAQPEDIIEYWESFGVSHNHVQSVLELLEFDCETRINLQELSSALEQELLNHDHGNSVYHVAVYSCRHELRYLKGVLETKSAEKDKLLQEIDAAKTRNDIIIKEADERHSNQEKQTEARINSIDTKYQEQIKSIQNQLDRERELLTSNAQLEKNRLELEINKAKEEEKRLKQELTFNKSELDNIEKELHTYIDKNAILGKENERIKRELASATERNSELEEMETQRHQLTNEKHMFSEQRIKELEEENKVLRDKADELTLEIEEVKMSSNKRSARGEGRRSRRGSLLSDYTQTQTEDAGQSSDQEIDESKKRKLQPSYEEEQLRIEILKLKDQHADQMVKIRKVHDAEKMDLQEAFKNDVTEIEQKNTKQMAKLEKQLDEERYGRNASESEWRRKYETEKAQIKLAATRERMELVNKMQEEHREQMKELRQEMNQQHDKEMQLCKDQYNQEKELLENRLQKKIYGYETILDRGAESLQGKLKTDFYHLVEEQAQNEIEVEKRHLESVFQKDRDELYDLLNKEKQSMEDQFNERLYELEDQMEDVEENVRAQCEEEFVEQISVVQEAFNEERSDYENQISLLKNEIQKLERQLRSSVKESELDLLREQRDQALNDRDEIQLEKNKLMIERNNAQSELERLKRMYEKERKLLQEQIDDLQRSTAPESSRSKLSSARSPIPAMISPKITDTISEKSAMDEDRRALQEQISNLTEKLNEAEERIFKLSTDLQLAKSQHLREVQDLRSRPANTVSSEAFTKLEGRLKNEQKKCRELEDALNIRSSQGRRLLIDSEDQHNKILINLKFERDEYKNRLLATRNSLSEVTEKLKQQMVKSTRSDELVRELYIENANLVEALYITEKRQKLAVQNQFKLQHKCESITNAYKKFVPAVFEAVS